MTLAPMTHEEALEMAGLYALDAVTHDEKAAIDLHLAGCAEDHSEFASLGGVAQALALQAPPQDAPAALKGTVMAAYRAEMGTAPDVIRPAVATPATRDSSRVQERSVAIQPPHARRWQVPNWTGWAAAAIALVLFAVVSVAGLNLRQQADQANHRADQMAQAIAAISQPGSQIAILQGTGDAAGISGFVAVPAGGSGYMVVTDVPAVPSGMTLQAWYIVDGTPSSAGTMSAEPDGTVIASGLQPLPGTDVIAITLEPTGGSDQPTSAPIITGDVTTRT